MILVIENNLFMLGISKHNKKYPNEKIKEEDEI